MSHMPLHINLPIAHCVADESWIHEQLQQLPVAMRQRAIMRYAEVYQQAFDAELVSYRQENRARHEANTRLRLFVGNYYQAAMGLTEKATLSSTHAPVGAAAEIQPEQTAERWW